MGVKEQQAGYLTAAEAARYLGLSLSKVYELVEDRQLTVYRPAGRVLFRAAWLDEYRDRHTVKAR